MIIIEHDTRFDTMTIKSRNYEIFFRDVDFDVPQKIKNFLEDDCNIEEIKLIEN